MYDELVNRLRFYQSGTLYYKEAADAIEELSYKYQRAIDDLVKPDMDDRPKEGE